MRVGLVGPPTMRHFGSTFPPLTLVHLATILHTRGSELGLSLSVIDLQLAFTVGDLSMGDEDIHHKVTDIISPEQLDLLLIPTMCNNLPFSINIARMCKQRNPSLTVVIGGVQATLVASELVQAFPCIDVVVRGEGEETLLELINALTKGDSLHRVDGLAFRSGENVVMTNERAFLSDLDALPMPDLGLLEPMSRYQSERTWGDYAMFIDVGRGCPFQCTFCATSLFWRRRFRQKSAARIVAEMNHLFDHYGIGHFYFNQDDFTAIPARVVTFCEELVRQERHYDWRIYSRLGELNPSMIEMLAAANCGGVFCGIESGSAERHVRINKKVPLDEVLPRVEKLRQNGLECITSLILGFPDETWEEMDKTLSLGLKLAEAGATVSLQLLTPHPGTILWKEYEADIQLHPDYYPYYDNAEFLTHREHDLIARYPRIFTVFANYPTTCQPFSKVFNIYYDYGRCINRYAASIRAALQANNTSMIELHEHWREFVAEDQGRGPEDVIEDEDLDALFPRFLGDVKC